MRKVYIVAEDWCDRSNPGSQLSNVFSSLEKAKSVYKNILNAEDTQELINNILGRNLPNNTDCMEETEDSFECWEEGDWYSNHYIIEIKTLYLDESFDIDKVEGHNEN